MSGSCNTAEHKRCGVIVAGMHRSGTSALTRVLGYCGLAMPKTLVPPNEGNEAGHWESERVCDFNDKLLARFGLHWISWQPAGRDLSNESDYSELLEQASQIVRSEFGDQTDIALKDPRICLLLPFWLDVFARLDIEPAVVLVCRAPDQVGRSLERRNGILPAYGMLAWLRFMLEAERASRRSRRMVVTYDWLMSDWEGVVHSLNSRFGDESPICTKERPEEVRSFISNDLRHFSGDDGVSLPEWVSRTYSIISGWTSRPETADDHSILDLIRHAFDGAAPMFAGLVEPTDTVRRLEHELASAHARISEQETLLAAFKTEAKRVESPDHDFLEPMGDVCSDLPLACGDVAIPEPGIPKIPPALESE